MRRNGATRHELVWTNAEKRGNLSAPGQRRSWPCAALDDSGATKE